MRESSYDSLSSPISSVASILAHSSDGTSNETNLPKYVSCQTLDVVVVHYNVRTKDIPALQERRTFTAINF